MTRKKLPLAIAALTAGMFGSSVVYALGLGEIKLYSHLNEPLQAEIELVQVGDLNADEIITKMASKEAFDKAGIDRDFYLTQIKFEVILKPDGSGVLKLSSDKPTREPFLDFILDASWSNGHVLKQYTLLLDPPTYSAEGAAPTVSEPEPEAVVAPPPVAEQASSESASAEAATNVEAVKPPVETKPTIPVGTERYTTQKNDTLWSIASKHQASGASVHETMDAIHKLNQNAFIKNNRNLLKTDKALRLPSPEEVAYLSQGGSVNQLLADQRQTAQAPQLSTDQTTDPVEATSSDDKLKIVGSSTATESTGASTAGTSETIDKIDRDNQDMNVRLAELTSQIKTMQQLIQMQDQQLTSLQQQLGGGAPQKAEMKEAVEKLKVELSKVESEIDKAPATSTEVSVTAVPLPTTSTTTETVAPTAATTTASTESTAAPTAVAQPTTAPTVAPVATQLPATKLAEQKAVEVAPVEEESSSSWIAWLVGVLLGVGIAGAVLGKKLIDKRKAQQQPEENVEEADWSVDALRNEPSLASMSEASEEATNTESDAHETHTASIQAESKQVVDPLIEANGLADQGDLSGAINLLKEAISQNATRLDLRTRLLELSVDARDVATFEAQESYISRWGGAAAKQRAKELREVINAMPASTPVEAPSSAPMMDTSLDFDVDVTTPVIETPIEKTPDDELVSLDRLFDDAPAQVATQAKESAVVSSENDDLASLEHLFGDAPVEVKSEQSISESDDLASLDHLFDTAEQTVATPSASEEIEQPAPTNDDLASLDHLFDDASAEVAKSDDIEFDLSDFAVETTTDKTAAPELQQVAETDSPNDTSGEIDFSSELGLLDEEAATPVAETELDMSAALEELSTLAEATPAIEVEVAPVQEPEQVAAPAAASNEDDEFGFLAGTDEAATKLDLAKAYIDMEDIEGAKDILQEVLQEGNATQQQEAKDLLAKL